MKMAMNHSICPSIHLSICLSVMFFMSTSKLIAGGWVGWGQSGGVGGGELIGWVRNMPTVEVNVGSSFIKCIVITKLHCCACSS